MAGNFIDNVPVTDAGRVAASEAISEEVRSEFSVGRVLSETFRLLFAGLPHYVVYAILIGMIPGILTAAMFQFDALASIFDSESTSTIWVVVISWLLLLFLFLMAFVVATVIKSGSDFHRQSVSFDVVWANILKSTFPVTLVSLLALLASGLGFLLLVIPGYMVMCAFFVVHICQLEEQRGIFQSFDRSRELTRGYRWHIFGVYFVVLILTEISTRILEALDIYLNEWVYMIMASFDMFFTILLYSIASTLIFHMLRDLKEGSCTSHIEAVFE